MQEEPGATTIYGLIASDQREILVVPSAERWSLPRLPEAEAPEVASALYEALGLETILLGRIYDSAACTSATELAGMADGPLLRVLALACRGSGGEPRAGARWVNRADLEALPLTTPTLRPALLAWLRAAEGSVALPSQAPWERLDWWSVATGWIDSQLARLGYSLTGAVAQRRVRPWSSILCAPTTAGPLYFKAVAAPFGYEPRLTAELWALAPGRVPEVLALDEERHWLLLADAGRPFHAAVPSGDGLGRRAEMLRQLAALQQATIGYTERLLAGGCPDRRLTVLPALYRRMVADEAALLVGRPQGVSRAAVVQLQALAPEVERLCAELAGAGIPETLHHDDLGGGNVLVGPDGHYVFLDWAESGVTHPFCTLFITLRVERLVSGCDATSLDYLRDAYLSAWQDYASLPRLRVAFALAHRLGAVLRALTWRACIPHLPETERWEYEDAQPYFLLHFLDGRE
jgi:hypothetical protein